MLCQCTSRLSLTQTAAALTCLATFIDKSQGERWSLSFNDSHIISSILPPPLFSFLHAIPHCVAPAPAAAAVWRSLSRVSPSEPLSSLVTFYVFALGRAGSTSSAYLTYCMAFLGVCRAMAIALPERVRPELFRSLDATGFCRLEVPHVIKENVMVVHKWLVKQTPQVCVGSMI